MKDRLLVTTGLTEFWGDSEEVVCLGRWCLRADRADVWGGRRLTVMPSPWRDRRRYARACRYVDEVSERTLRRLTTYLHDRLGMIHDARYARVILGAWLFRFVHAAYDRYVHLLRARRLYPGLAVVAPAAGDFLTPAEGGRAIDLLWDDPYNLHLFSHLAALLGLRREVVREPAPSEAMKAGESAQDPAPVTAGENLPGVDPACDVAFCDLSFPVRTLCERAEGAGLRAVRQAVSHRWPFAIPPASDSPERRGLAGLAASDSFERVLAALLPLHFPRLYLEGFDAARADTRRRFPSPKLIVSEVGWHFNEPLKFLGAEALLRGARLVGAQHGGGYGMFRESPMETHERRVSDVYLSWGWGSRPGNGLCRTVTVPSPQLYLHARRDRVGSESPRGAVFVSTEFPRYLMRFESAPQADQWDTYYRWQRDFFLSLPAELRARFVFRPFFFRFQQFGWDRAIRAWPELSVDPPTPAHELIRRSRLAVIDHCSTAILEALVADVPTVVFWPRGWWESRPEAAPYLGALEAAGVYWPTANGAARMVRRVWEAPETWWRGARVREARRSFVERFAKTDPNWAEKWVHALVQEIPAPEGAKRRPARPGLRACREAPRAGAGM